MNKFTIHFYNSIVLPVHLIILLIIINKINSGLNENPVNSLNRCALD